MKVHLFEKLFSDEETGCRADDGIYAALRAQSARAYAMLILINPICNFERTVNLQAIEAAATFTTQ